MIYMHLLTLCIRLNTHILGHEYFEIYSETLNTTSWY